MTDAVLTAQIRSIELQLAVLKAQLQQTGDRSTSVRSLGDLYGVLAGTGSSSEEDIDSAIKDKG
jgi:hypothetical protein